MPSSKIATPTKVELHRALTRIYDHLYANAPVRTPEGIAAEVSKVLHTGLFREEFLRLSPAFCLSASDSRALLGGNDSRAADVALGVRDDFRQMNLVWRLYDAEDVPRISDNDVAYVCAALSGIQLSSPSCDVIGELTELIRSRWTKEIGGQFFTDPLVTELAMNLLRFRPLYGDDLVDLCAGTGGFLLAGLAKIRKDLGQTTSREPDASLADMALRALRGKEVDERIAGLANAGLAIRLGLSDVTVVVSGDSLDPDGLAGDAPISFDRHLCAATNPPFGTKITIKDPRLLRHFDLACSISRTGTPDNGVRRSTAPDILFLEQNLKILKPGEGRLAIVLPYQLLSGPQARFVREWLLRNASILCVVDLPADTFQPHTGTKTALLVVKRREAPLVSLIDPGDPPIFMAVPKHIGHDRRGNPVYRRQPDGKLTDEVLTDLPIVGNCYASFLEGSLENADTSGFSVDPQSIFDDEFLRFNASYHWLRLQATRNTRNGVAVVGDEVSLGSLVGRVFFPTRFKRHYVSRGSSGIPFLGGTNITELIPSGVKYLHAQEARLPDLIVREGWILVTRSGSTGIVSSVPKAWDGYAMSEHIIRIIPDDSKLPGEYIEAFLRSSAGQAQIAMGVFGSVIDEISPEHLAQIRIPVPQNPDEVSSVVDLVRQARTARQQAAEAWESAQELLETGIVP